MINPELPSPEPRLPSPDGIGLGSTPPSTTYDTRSRVTLVNSTG
jgi:hypothetical protein